MAVRLVCAAMVATAAGTRCPAAPSASDEPRRLLVVSVPGLRADDIQHPRSQALRSLASRAAVGWMNTRTARVPGQRRDPPEAVYVSLASGARAKVGEWVGRPSLATMDRLARLNTTLNYRVPVGALGRAVLGAGGSTEAVGNEDDTAPRRAALLLAMDPLGRVSRDATGAGPPRGSQSLAPFGIRQTYRDFAVPRATLTVWVFGDVVRADRYARLCTPAAAASHRDAALAGLDAFLERRVLPLLQQRELAVALIAPGPAPSAPDGDRLAPVVWSAGGASRGLLTSPSTRTPGLVTVTDFLPSALHWLRLKEPPGLVGRPWYAGGEAPDGATEAARWASLYRAWLDRSERQRAFGGLAGLQAALAFAGFLLVWRGGRAGAVRACALAVLVLPAFHLLAPVVPMPGLWAAWAAAIACMVGVGLVGAMGPTPLVRAVGVGCAGLVAAVAPVDLATGGDLVRGAWMGYSVMEGARYYGIGNELGGALLGCGLVAISAAAPLAAQVGRAALASWALVTVFLVGSPGAGANVGAFAGAAAGLGACAVVLLRASGRGRAGLVVVASAAALTVAIGAIDVLAGPHAQSHLARALLQGPELPMLVARKVQLNLFLILHSVWALGLVAGLLWYAACRARIEGPLSMSDRLRRAGLLAGGGAMLALNDSGVVAAALTVLPVAAASALWLPRLPEPSGVPCEPSSPA
ncbi:MAG TPA: hypothetical protein VLH79_11510 [Chthonomonadales bacterium]|nr:hypothetical protein [Chthonomonadales bacterium]